MRNAPFKSIYRDNIRVVEERRGNLTLFPHTDQLPMLYRALNLEFLGGLPGRIARVDARADDYHKLLRYVAAFNFCTLINGDRSDEVRLLPMFTPDKVATPAIVQQISESSRDGRSHWFRFYGETGFLPDVHLMGQRFAFASHVFDQFSSRVPRGMESDLVTFLIYLLSSRAVVADLGVSSALAYDYHGSLVTLPYKAREDGSIFFTTFLTINEIHTLEFPQPVTAAHFHYGKEYTPPAQLDWNPQEHSLKLQSLWEHKSPLPPPLEKFDDHSTWGDWGARTKESAEWFGITPDSKMKFADDVYGPFVTFTGLPPRRRRQFDD